ncbi:hypothetical protein NEF87_001149 [Candidatus Lokiarchaeum ossiferum]|uniref:Peptidase M6-like domain-containing protein n=1 Tax=Candidatus Lokiarchaeum ossiferum TaxID=2951803 RepID=A0ABY6HQV8_9ARCH|nr:hypothetical protein NEF87_001149 [Candidatus Lokiarchaeum sp. B-35]
MKRKVMMCLILPMLFIGSFILALTMTSSATTIDETIMKQPMDIGPRLRETKMSDLPSVSSPEINVADAISTLDGEDYYPIGAIVNWYCLDDYSADVPDGIFVDAFELRAIGEHTEIWVQVDMSFPDNRDTPIITDDHVDYMMDEFEGNIYPKVSSYFGVPEFHDGTLAELNESYVDPAGRDVILISNIRDEAYYDDSYPYYIVGFYWGVFEDAFDRNIISIDSADWDNRAEMYMGTVAHEYQHLIHDDWNPDDDTFMNEGCSMYAEPLCGYGVSWGDIEAYLATPDNSLTEWGDQGDINILADYGCSLLWSIYLGDHYGAEFLSYFVKTGIPGILGLNNALNHFGYTETFTEIYHDWRIANLLHSDYAGNEKYNYIFIDIGAYFEENPARIYNVMQPSVTDYFGSDFGETKSYLNDRTGFTRLGSYGSDYIKFNNLKESFLPSFEFNGDDVADKPTWIQVDQDGDGDLEWYSTSSIPEYDLALTAEFDLTGFVDPVLNFETMYIIEHEWDFGFVQISTDGGETWTSLANDYTTDEIHPDGYPAIKEELPGLDGESDGWITMKFDLSAYSGEVMLAFRYMTDWGTEEEGWYVDNIAINGVIIDDADDLVIFTAPAKPNTDFIVTLIKVDIVDGVELYSNIMTLVLDDLSEETLEAIDLANYATGDHTLMIVSCTEGLADYQFSILRN